MERRIKGGLLKSWRSSPFSLLKEIKVYTIIFSYKTRDWGLKKSRAMIKLNTEENDNNW